MDSFCSEGDQERSEAGVADGVADGTQPGGEGVAGERPAVPMQFVLDGSGGPFECRDVAGDGPAGRLAGPGRLRGC